MKKLLRIAAASVMAISLTTGVVSANSGSNDTTGPDSTNVNDIRNRHNVEVKNEADIELRNSTYNAAYTGDANARRNTTVDDVGTGDARADNLFRASVRVDNDGATTAALNNGSGNGSADFSNHLTGPDSVNRNILRNSSNVEVKNKTDVNISNHTYNKASSGDASASRNTTVGNVTTGNADAINTTDVTITVTN